MDRSGVGAMMKVETYSRDDRGIVGRLADDFGMMGKVLE